MAKRGNVLFLILLAVALFAALSYAVTQSSRSGGNNISDEHARLIAAQLIQHSDVIKRTVERLRLINQCNVSQISFNYDTNKDGSIDASDVYYNANSPSDKRCHVFDPAGGNISSAYFVEQVNSESFSSASRDYFIRSTRVVNVGTTAANNSAVELIHIVTDLPQNVCIELNNKLDVENPAGIPPEDSNITTGDFYRGAFTLNNGSVLGNDSTQLIGKHQGCFLESEQSGSVNHVYYNVFIPR